jgi:hypothetical protein
VVICGCAADEIAVLLLVEAVPLRVFQRFDLQD